MNRPSWLDYIVLFCRLRQQQPFPSTAADLYYYLLYRANSLSWKNPFQEGNPIIMATLGMSDKTLMSAREKLVAAGLLRFTAGKKGYYSTYELLYLENNTENFRSIRELSGSNAGAVREQPGGNAPSNIRYKSKRKNKEASASASAATSSLPSPPVEVAGELWAAWLAQHAPDVQQMKQPLTAVQWAQLVADFGEPTVREVLLAMHNTTGAEKKYKSAYLTARNWCNRRQPVRPAPPPAPAGPAQTTEPELNPEVVAQRQAQREADAAAARRRVRTGSLVS